MADCGHEFLPSKLTSVYKNKPNDFDLGCDTDGLVSSESEGAKKDESLKANEEDSPSSPGDKKKRKARQAEAKEACADADPFSHSPCNKCYWKATAVGYLAVCVLLAIIYVAIYAEQHGLYGSYYDNLENLGRPLAPQTENDAEFRFIDAPYTEWLAQRWALPGTNLSNWPMLPKGLETVHQVVGGHIGSDPGVWIVTDNAVLFVGGVTGEETALQIVNASEGVGLKVTTPTRLAVAFNESVYVVQANSITIVKCSSVSVKNCFIVASLTKLDFGQVSAVSISASSNQLWIGSDKGLSVSAITSTSISLPVKVAPVDGPVYSMAWRSPLAISMVTKDDIPSEQWTGCDLLKMCTEELISQMQERDELWLPCVIERANFITNASCQLHIGTSSTHAVTGGHIGNSTLLEMWDQHQLASSQSLLSSPPKQPTKADLFGLLAVGDGWKLHFFDGKQWWFEWASVWRDGLGGVVDGPVTSLAFVPTGELFIGNNVSLSRLNVNYTIDRLGPLQGLPTGNITSLTFLSATFRYPDPFLGKRRGGEELGSVVVATEMGLTILDVASSEFVAYFFGRRWLPGNFVSVATSVSTDTIVAISDGGWAIIRAEDWTLRQKAEHYQAILPRHTRPPGIVADCSLTNFEPTTCAPHTTDNDGLWTSWLVAAEAFRYQVEKNETAHENAWQLFKGMDFLNVVTGVDGLMARSVVSINSSVSGGTWHNSTTEPGWKWKGDTSSDEVVGHMFALPIIYDLVANEGAEKAEVLALIDNIVGYIKRNKYYLIDVTGRPTRWGVWAPEQINLNQSWADEHGINSLQILTYLLSAYRVTGKEEYLEGWLNLYNGSTGSLTNHYGMNMINQKITFPADDNFSDDELSFLPYFIYMYTLKLLKESSSVSTEGLLGTADLSLQRTWKYVGPGKSSAWSTIYCYGIGTNDTEAVRNLVWNLRTWPLELVQWETQNSHRLDIRFNPEPDRDFHYHSQSVRVLPANERGQLRWNGNPFQLDSGATSSEMDPGPWLMPYWMARWAGLL